MGEVIRLQAADPERGDQLLTTVRKLETASTNSIRAFAQCAQELRALSSVISVLPEGEERDLMQNTSLRLRDALKSALVAITNAL